MAEPAKAVPKQTGAAARITKLEKQLAELAWYHAELVYGLRLMAARQAANSPEVRQYLEQQLMAKMASASPANPLFG